MRVLVTNDDGIYADGIEKLAAYLRRKADVTVVAPDVERSAVGHAITLNNPLRVEEVRRNGRFFGYSVNGTPADCVKIGLDAILREKPDAVFSGINAGSNLSTNLIYSGTVSAAIEGAIMGICSVAISVFRTDEIQYDYAGGFALHLLEVLAGKGFPKVLLNVNVPPVLPGEVKGVRLTRQGGMQFRDYFDRRQDPAGRTYYWLTGEMINTEKHPEADSTAVDEGYVSVTPIQYDLTDEQLLEELKGWDLTA